MTSSFVWWSNQMQTQTRNEAEQQLHLELASHLVSDNPILHEGVFDYEALSNLFHTLMVLGPNFEFYYVDPQGKMLTHSAKPGGVQLESIDITPIIQLLEAEASLPIYGENPKDPSEKKIFSAAPVFKNDALQGYLYVIIGAEKYDSLLAKLSNDRTYSQFMTLGIISLLLFLVTLVVLFSFLTKPMKQLTVVMESFRDADYDLGKTKFKPHPWRRDSIDEIQKLGCAFNDMVAHIDAQFNKLQTLDESRRIMLADLSHDLRTPLANLQGYIETLAINDENLSGSDRKRFIDISLKNAQNLKRLIDQIFDLTYIVAGQVTLNCEPFPIAELMHDIAAKFALKAKAKDIRLQVEPGQFGHLVYADIGKLEQVLTNLVENAIRHTSESGAITLEMSTQADMIEIAVQDTGVGIAENELGFIFEARYQATNTQADSVQHAGLGLAICQKTLALLGSKLQVQSVVGKGTRFYFQLPRD